jgi:hypothetical protein
MKKIMLPCTLLLCLILAFNASCQNGGKNQATTQKSEPLIAVTNTVFIDNADKGEYYAGITITKGKIKIGDKIDAVGKTGNRFSFEVKEIKVNDITVKETGATDNAFLVLKCNGKADGFDAGFAIAHKGENPTQSANTATVGTANPVGNADFSCLLNGKAWQGSNFLHSHVFYTKGIDGAYNGQPYLMLAFKAKNTPDSRQFTFVLYDYKGQTGIFQNQQIEVLLSGAENGMGKDDILQDHKTPATATNFKIEISSFEKLNASQGVISGKVSGELKGIMGAPSINVQQGVFQKIKVEIFNDAY